MRLAVPVAVSALLASCAVGPSDRQQEVAACMTQALTGFPGVTNVTSAPDGGEMRIGFFLAPAGAPAVPGAIHIIRQPEGANTSVGFWMALDGRYSDDIRKLLEIKCPGAGDIVVVT